jgi:myo-inositol 2-dehydrogenase/D-chiro-inositol 1-dehydrogenase
MGRDHIRRLTSTITGATVTAIIEPDAARAASATALAPGSRVFPRIEDALEADAVDAVLVASPGRFHESALLATLDAGVPTLCEKPLTEDAASAWRLVEAEQRAGRRLVQVGFMRRFDSGYRALRRLISSGDAGDLLLLHCTHRAPSVPSTFTQEMRVTDSAAHEFDIVPWLADSPIRNLEVRIGRTTSRAGIGVREPIMLVLELESGVLADVEINLSSRYGYEVSAEAVLEDGVARMGHPQGLELAQNGVRSVDVAQSFTSRFQSAYDRELQEWVDTAARGSTAGPSIWDGYAVAVACEAGLRALSAGGRVAVELPEKPLLYVEGR